MRVTARIALDHLKSARVQREHYIGEWLPEPIPAASDFASGMATDPADAVVIQDDVSQAILILLERLTPAERAVYVLRESFALPYAEIAEILQRTPGACRQLFSTATRHLQESFLSHQVTPIEHDDAVRAFVSACVTGDLASLAKSLDPAVVVRSDGGGKVSAARRPVVGLERVSRLLIGLRTKYPHATVQLARTPGALGAVMLLEGQIAGVMTCATGARGIASIWIMRNPDKLTLWEGSLSEADPGSSEVLC
ncbi:sigma factor-like helix-turn-helix DNA-binding protein [Nesterenkonia ebinurensis]|uniref:sigma factor-like helix-turn-helix DNA-binding protein n=1 Tax=Nesterenkonia ebinurensis TaxID=2608252 RepID=UPI00123DA708|nr:sigma factor-like helix-turn-helix DNA-binding protein [Nesterenkonia ebinurensis]